MVQVKKLYLCQKAIIVKKDHEKINATDVNFSLNKNDMMEAMRNLTPSGFSLYMYCASNMEGYTFGLSKTDVCAVTGISNRSYNNAVAELVDKGYFYYTKMTATDGVVNAPLYEFRSRPDAKLA